MHSTNNLIVNPKSATKLCNAGTLPRCGELCDLQAVVPTAVAIAKYFLHNRTARAAETDSHHQSMRPGLGPQQRVPGSISDKESQTAPPTWRCTARNRSTSNRARFGVELSDFLQCLGSICLSIICFFFSSLPHLGRDSLAIAAQVSHAHIFGAVDVDGAAICTYATPINLYPPPRHALIRSSFAIFTPLPIPVLSAFSLWSLGFQTSVLGRQSSVSSLQPSRSAHACAAVAPPLLGFSFFWSDRCSDGRRNLLAAARSPAPHLCTCINRRIHDHESAKTWASHRRRQLSRCDKQIFCIYGKRKRRLSRHSGA